MIDLDVVPPAGLAHAGFVVRKMDSAIRRWQAEGYEVTLEPKVDPIQKVVVAVVEDGVAAVELVAPSGADGSPVDARLKRGGGLDHLCYYVDDVAANLEKDKELGGIIVCEPVYAVAFGRTIGFVQRRSGLVVEYMSRERSDR